jgi:Helix-loop-helix DNA-binding domain
LKGANNFAYFDEASAAKNKVFFNSRSASVWASTSSSQIEKCRELRDLHNSLERQRRVDLRLNFDKLRSVVPELCGLEKASKLTILNTAANYCQLLATIEGRLAKERNSESTKHYRLKKRLKSLIL